MGDPPPGWRNPFTKKKGAPATPLVHPYLKETLAAESVLESLKPDWNSETELPTAGAAIFDISPVTAVLDTDDVLWLENLPWFLKNSSSNG
jgi:hypothetical protein